jgi:hypothetical protein
MFERTAAQESWTDAVTISRPTPCRQAKSVTHGACLFARRHSADKQVDRCGAEVVIQWTAENDGAVG